MCSLSLTSRYKNAINSRYKIIKFNDFVQGDGNIQTAYTNALS